MVMDAASIGAAVTSLNAVKGIVELAFSAKLDSERRAARSEALTALGNAQDTLYELREELFRLQDENRALKRAQEDADSRAAKTADYEIFRAPGGASVYRSKADPSLYACPTCIGGGTVSMLQPVGKYSGALRCVACKVNFQLEPDPHLPNVYPTNNSPWSTHRTRI